MISREPDNTGCFGERSWWPDSSGGGRLFTVCSVTSFHFEFSKCGTYSQLILWAPSPEILVLAVSVGAWRLEHSHSDLCLGWGLLVQVTDLLACPLRKQCHVCTSPQVEEVQEGRNLRLGQFVLGHFLKLWEAHACRVFVIPGDSLIFVHLEVQWLSLT